MKFIPVLVSTDKTIGVLFAGKLDSPGCWVVDANGANKAVAILKDTSEES